MTLKVTLSRAPSITPMMNTPLNHRPSWDVDRMLERLRGEAVRVAAKSFSPPSRIGDASLRFRPVRELFLPDNTQPAGLPVFFEGRLLEFERQIGVVCVRLEAPLLPTRAPDGLAYFRGQAVVILCGPAVVELAFPFHVERLPSDPDNYWRELRWPCAQFEFSLFREKGTGAEHPSDSAEKTTAMISRGYAGAID